jgi:phosphatidylinositol alpha 1,6-mannosyltransferase
MPPPRALRIAYFPDSFHEVNGVAHTSRNFASYARRHDVPMLCVRAGQTTRVLAPDGSVEALELGRSPLAVQVEKDLSFDPLFFRYSDLISATVRAFRPDVIHITGPSELGLFGAYFAHQLNVPLVASWHTNLHEYAARRMRWLSRHMGFVGGKLERIVEAATLNLTSHLYRRAQALYAPNPTLCTLLERTTHRPCHLMQRGVDTTLFTPTRRTDDGEILLGYVGRLSVEKNVALLPQVDAQLRRLGITPRWLIIGHGAEEAHLRRALPNAVLPGVLRDDALASAYANMDLLIFPSHTDTFGNVVLEALASGVPAIVTPDGGPAHILHSAMQSATSCCDKCAATITPGRIANDEDFATAIAAVLNDSTTHAAMRLSARTYAQCCSWDTVFDRVLAAYPAASTHHQ